MNYPARIRSEETALKSLVWKMLGFRTLFGRLTAVAILIAVAACSGAQSSRVVPESRTVSDLCQLPESGLRKTLVAGPGNPCDLSGYDPPGGFGGPDAADDPWPYEPIVLPPVPYSNPPPIPTAPPGYVEDPTPPFVDPSNAPDQTIYEPWIILNGVINYASPASTTYLTLPAVNFTDVELAIRPALYKKQPIANAGHLYVVMWSHGRTVGPPFEGGPFSYSSPPAAPYYLGVMDYGETPFIDTSVYLPNFGPYTAQCLVQHMTNYYDDKPSWPLYGYVTMNSNTFADGLLLSCGYPQALLTYAELALTASNRSHLIPYGASQGAALLGYFSF